MTGARFFEKAYQSRKATSWPLADAAYASLGYGMAGSKDLQARVLKDALERKLIDMDLFDTYAFNYLTGKIDADTLIRKRGGDPYYLAQARFIIGFDLAGRGQEKEARAYLSKCDVAAWAATDDFKLPLEAIARLYLARQPQ